MSEYNDWRIVALAPFVMLGWLIFYRPFRPIRHAMKRRRRKRREQQIQVASQGQSSFRNPNQLLQQLDHARSRSEAKELLRFCESASDGSCDHDYQYVRGCIYVRLENYQKAAECFRIIWLDFEHRLPSSVLTLKTLEIPRYDFIIEYSRVLLNASDPAQALQMTKHALEDISVTD